MSKHRGQPDDDDQTADDLYRGFLEKIQYGMGYYGFVTEAAARAALDKIFAAGQEAGRRETPDRSAVEESL